MSEKLQPLGMVLVPRPFGQIITGLDNVRAVKDMAGRPEGCRYFPTRSEIKQCGKGQPHLASFIGNGRAAPGAADLAGQNTGVLVAFAVVKTQVLNAGGDSDVFFMENGSPLHGGAVKPLADQTMADFGVHGIGAYLIADGPAVATGLVFGNKGRIMDRCVFRPEIAFHMPPKIPYKFLPADGRARQWKDR